MAKKSFFVNPEVAKNYVLVPEDHPDFNIHVPAKNWPPKGDPGKFSTITPEVAEQLITEGYNRIARVGEPPVE